MATEPAPLDLPPEVDLDLLRRLARDRPWFHTIDLGHGITTRGVDDTPAKEKFVAFPESLSGKTVLDVGAFDGYFSFAAERRGASRVVAADEFCWSRPGDPMTDGRGFDIAHWALRSRVEKRRIPVEDISPATVGMFDVVLFLGVLYHMRHPLLALERVADVTDELLVMETLVDLTYVRSPAAAFYPWALFRDDSNWWGPNQAAVMGMLRSVGFARTAAYPAKRITRARLRGMPARARTNSELVSTTPVGSRVRLLKDVARSALTQNRLVTHAWK